MIDCPIRRVAGACHDLVNASEDYANYSRQITAIKRLQHNRRRQRVGLTRACDRLPSRAAAQSHNANFGNLIPIGGGPASGVVGCNAACEVGQPRKVPLLRLKSAYYSDPRKRSDGKT